MKTKFNQFVRAFRSQMHKFSFLLVVLLVVVAYNFTACAALPNGVEGGVSAVQITQAQLNAAQANGTIDLYLKTGGTVCSSCWLSWAQGGGRIYAMAQVGKDGILEVLPTARMAVGDSSVAYVEQSLKTGGDWQNIGQLVPTMLALITRNPGLLTISVMEFTPDSLGWNQFQRLAYPVTAQ
jgi:hypothetical protein